MPGLIFLRFHEERLKRVSYLASRGEGALVVDPQREIQVYLEAAMARGLAITHVFQTSPNGEDLAGARELTERVGARLFVPQEQTGATVLRDGDLVPVGQLTLHALSTPGPAPEHLALLLSERGVDVSFGCFTGDLLSPPVAGATDATLRQHYDSLRRLGTWPGYLELWPGGTPASDVGFTLGYRKLCDPLWRAEAWEDLRRLAVGQR